MGQDLDASSLKSSSNPRIEERLARHLWVVLLAPLVVGVISAISTALITGAWHPFTSAKLTRTEIRLFTSGEVLGLPANLRVARRASGGCTYSSVLAAPEAYRCGAAAVIYDPCLGYPPRLMCVESPWTQEAVQLHVATPIHPPPTRSLAEVLKTRPWALELSNGERCVSVAGATFVVTGARANYECSRTTGFNGGTGAWLIGVPDRTQQPWEVTFLAERDSATTQIAVRVAWF